VCDYSLYAIPNRLAVEGEELAVHRFSSGSMGLASTPDLVKLAENARRPCSKRSLWTTLKNLLAPPVDPVVPAVCIPPGARLAWKNSSADSQLRLGIRLGDEVTFTQIGACANTYRDAIRLPNGVEVLLQSLREGDSFQVISLGTDAPERLPVHETESVAW
jgi:hypothetical protein